ncbi:MAG: DnaJ domain-containing protein [Acidobacteria bacterium]|nr:DnaJ domain-containing protein [Acidobacteriota bacterium]
MRYKDYYAILGVERGAGADAIKKAYRKLARENHPDVNKSAGAEDKFREINEAYEVLGDPEKRRRYDQLGANWQEGAPFEPPPGFQGYEVRFEDLGELFGARGGRPASGFSDFFETLFGNLGFSGGAFGREAAGAAEPGRGRGRGRARGGRGQDVEAEIELGLADLLHPGQRRITLGVPATTGGVERKTVTVNIPAGVRPGQRLRLPGQGSPGSSGPGDIYLVVRLRPDAALRIEGDDLVTDIDVPAPTAVTGGTVEIPTPDGPLTLRISPGTQAGTVLRARGKGLPLRADRRGDLRARVRITVPNDPTPAQRELYRKLADLEKA